MYFISKFQKSSPFGRFLLGFPLYLLVGFGIFALRAISLGFPLCMCFSYAFRMLSLCFSYAFLLLSLTYAFPMLFLCSSYALHRKTHRGKRANTIPFKEIRMLKRDEGLPKAAKGC